MSTDADSPTHRPTLSEEAGIEEIAAFEPPSVTEHGYSHSLVATLLEGFSTSTMYVLERDDGPTTIERAYQFESDEVAGEAAAIFEYPDLDRGPFAFLPPTGELRFFLVWRLAIAHCRGQDARITDIDESVVDELRRAVPTEHEDAVESLITDALAPDAR